MIWVYKSMHFYMKYRKNYILNKFVDPAEIWSQALFKRNPVHTFLKCFKT